MEMVQFQEAPSHGKKNVYGNLGPIYFLDTGGLFFISHVMCVERDLAPVMVWGGNPRVIPRGLPENPL